MRSRSTIGESVEFDLPLIKRERSKKTPAGKEDRPGFPLTGTAERNRYEYTKNNE